MKRTRIVASSKPVTTIRVSGKSHHYFHSEALGGCRAIIISEDENLPATPTLSKGDRLKILMDCAERLSKRYWDFYITYDACDENDYKGRKSAFAKMERVSQASDRIFSRIKGLLL